MSPNDQRCKGMRFLKPQGKKKIGAVGLNLRSLTIVLQDHYTEHVFNHILLSNQQSLH